MRDLEISLGENADTREIFTRAEGGRTVFFEGWGYEWLTLADDYQRQDASRPTYFSFDENIIPDIIAAKSTSVVTGKQTMSQGSEPTKRERLAEIFRRLDAALPAGSDEEALALLCRIITEVEDELTSIPNDPPTPPLDDGRIYPPHEDSRRVVPGRPDLRRYRSRGHNTLIRDNGAISIVDLNNVTVYSKPGADGERA